MTTYRTCFDCERPMRAKRQSAEDHPGTVAHNGRGLCSVCYHARNRAGTLQDTPTVRPILKPEFPAVCIDCGQPLRSWRATEDEAPGTVPHGAKGLCKTDYGRRYRAGTLNSIPGKPAEPAPKPKPVVIQATPDPGLDAYMRERKARIEKARRMARVRRAYGRAA